MALIIVLGEWSGLARSAAGGPYLAALLDVALVGVLLWALRTRRTPHDRSSRLLGLLTVAYLAVATAEVLNPNVPDLAVGLQGLRKSGFPALALIVMLWAGQEIELTRFLRIIAIGSFPALLWAIRQVYLPLDVDLGIIETSSVSPITFHSGAVLRAFSPTSGPFHLGALSAIVLGVCLIQGWVSNRGWYALAAVPAVALGLTLTRGNIISGMVTAAVLAWWLTQGWRRAAALTVSAAFYALVLVTAALASSGPVSTIPRVPPTAAPSPSAAPSPTAAPSPSAAPSPTAVQGISLNPLDDKNFRFRVQFWAEQVAAIAANPFIGYGTSAAADGFKAQYDAAGRIRFAPHSMYTKVLLELGLLGGIVALSIVLVALRLWLRAFRADRLSALHSAAVLLPIAIAGLAAPMLDAYPLNLLVWSVVGWLGSSKSGQSVTAPRP